MTKRKTYIVEVKMGDRANGSPVMKVWHVNDLISFTKFLDKKHKSWKWFNVLDKNTGVKLASFTINTLPISRHLNE